MTETAQNMATWAIPLDFKVFGYDIGDHTWVASDEGYCQGCRFGTVTTPDPYYCATGRWQGGQYTPPSKTSRKLVSGQDLSNTAMCMAGSPYTFMGIPSQAGIVYMLNGVCHTLSNRTLYPSNVTVEGALGYWFIQSIFGTYGTIIPPMLMAPLIPVPFFPFWIPNPIAPVAIAWFAAINIQWSNIKAKCGVKTADGGGANAWDTYLRSVQQLHEQPILPEEKNVWTASEHFDLVNKTFERHMKEIDLTLEYRKGNVASSKISDLRKLWADFHKPSQGHIKAFFEGKDSVNLNQLPDVKLSEYETITLANIMNMDIGRQLNKITDLLGPEDFKTVYGHAQEDSFLVINPMLLKGALT